MCNRMSPTRVFRTEIPDDLVLSIFKAIGVKDYCDDHYWSKYNFNQAVCNQLDLLLIKLEPYYFPHKKFLIKREMNENRYIQMIRQVCKAKGFVLESKEYKDKNQNRKKVILYRIITGKKEFSQPTFVVTFE
jgi:hypothetical protein